MKDMKKEIKEYTDKKPMKEFNDMDKSCKNCNKRDNCTLHSCALTAITNFHEHGFYCCDYEPKKKTVKMYAHLDYNNDYNCSMLVYLDAALGGLTRVPSEDKEIQI